jgi:hypothetical protein
VFGLSLFWLHSRILDVNFRKSYKPASGQVEGAQRCTPWVPKTPIFNIPLSLGASVQRNMDRRNLSKD